MQRGDLFPRKGSVGRATMDLLLKKTSNLPWGIAVWNLSPLMHLLLLILISIDTGIWLKVKPEGPPQSLYCNLIYFKKSYLGF